MKIKIFVSSDGKRSIVISDKQKSSFTPSPVTNQNIDNDSGNNESITSQSELSEYEETEDDKYAAPHKPYLSKATKSHAENTDRDIEMTDAPEEVTNHIQVSKPEIMEKQPATGYFEAISKPTIGEDSPANATTSTIATSTAFETPGSEPMAYSALKKVASPAPVTNIGEKLNPDKPIPTIEVPNTPKSPYSAIPTRKPKTKPSPIAYYDATYAFYVDGVYEFWSMGLKKTQVAGFIKFLAKKSAEEQKLQILKLMTQVSKLRIWKRLIRKDGEAARKARDAAVLSSVYLTTMAGVSIENGKAIKFEERKDIKVEGKNPEDWPLAWVHIREFEHKDSEIWMVGKDFTIDDMV